MESVFFDLETGPKGRKRQYDVLIFAKDNQGEENIFVVEVKNQARAEDFDRLKKALEELPELFPLVQNKKLILVLAAFRFPEDLLNLANKRKVLLVRMGGDYLEPLNPQVLSSN